MVDAPREAREILDRWVWSHDDEEAAAALMAIPKAPALTDSVLHMCVRNSSLTPATVAVVRKYAARRGVDDAIRDRVLRVCVMALRFLRPCAFLLLEAIYRFDDDDHQEVMDACVACIGPDYPLNVRLLAMHIVACTVQLCDDGLADSFEYVCTLATQNSVTAPALMKRIANHDTQLLHRSISRCLEVGNCTRPAVDMAMDMVDARPAFAVSIGAIQIILKAGHELPDSVMAACWATRPVASRHELLVYIAKFGLVPPGAERIWAHVLGSCTIKTKVLYVSFLSERAQIAPSPVKLAPFSEAHTGCIRLCTTDGDGVLVLMSMLARHAEMFDRAQSWGQSDTFHVQCTQATAEKLRDLVYYGADVDMGSYTLDDAQQLVTLCDMIGARVILRLVLYRMATLDFWAAWDLTHEWADAKPVLRYAAQEQLPTLVRCSRMLEICSVVAGCT